MPSTIPPRVGWYQVKENELTRTEQLTEVFKWDAKIVQAGDFAIPQKFYIFNNFKTPEVSNPNEQDCADMINVRISVRDMSGGLGQPSTIDPSLEGQQLGNANLDKNEINPYDRDFTGNAITGGGIKDEYGTRATVYMVMYNGEYRESGETSPSGGWGFFNEANGLFERWFASEDEITGGDSVLVNNPQHWQPLNSAPENARNLCNARGISVDDALGDCFNISGKRSNITGATYGTGDGQNIWDVTAENERMLNCAVVYLTLHAKSDAAAGTVMWRTRVSYQFK